jgi:hypothetical protein
MGVRPLLALVRRAATPARVHVAGQRARARELRAADAACLHRGGEVVEESDLPDHVLTATAAEAEPRALDLRSAVETAERNAIIEALRRQGGNRLRAAQELGISERGLYLKAAEARPLRIARGRLGGRVPPGDMKGKSPRPELYSDCRRAMFPRVRSRARVVDCDCSLARDPRPPMMRALPPAVLRRSRP